MPAFKKCGALALVVSALSVIVVANASAAAFTASSVGPFTGQATEAHVFTTSSGQIKCTTVEASGTVTSLTSSEQHMTMNYKNCTAFGFASVHISPATYLFTANGTVHFKNSIKVNVTVAGCEIIFIPQSVNRVTILNNPSHTDYHIISHLSGVQWTTIPAHGSLCGTAGSAGAAAGVETINKAITVDP